MVMPEKMQDAMYDHMRPVAHTPTRLRHFFAYNRRTDGDVAEKVQFGIERAVGWKGQHIGGAVPLAKLRVEVASLLSSNYPDADSSGIFRRAQRNLRPTAYEVRAGHVS